jgi:hypothetical protein
VIDSNDLTSQSAPAVVAEAGSLGNAALVLLNRLASPSGAGIANRSSEPVQAPNNWWGCNDGPGSARCTRIVGNGTVVASPWLTFTLEATDQRIVSRPGGTTALRAALLRSSDGTDLPWRVKSPRLPVSFRTSAGSLSAATTSLMQGQTSVVLTADASDGADVTATLDNQTVSTRVDFGPAPAPEQPPAAPKEQQQPAPPADVPRARRRRPRARHRTACRPATVRPRSPARASCRGACCAASSTRRRGWSRASA